MNRIISEKTVLFFVPRMGGGGAERVIATLSNELVERNYEVIILTLTSNDSFYHLDDRVVIKGANYNIEKNNKIKRNINLFINGVKSLGYLRKNIKLFKPDIIISFLTHTNLLSIITKLTRPNQKLIVSERAEPNKRNFVFKVATKYLYPIADAVVCQSSRVVEFFPEKDNDKMHVIENPISTKNLPENPSINRRKVIVGVGRLAKQKNFKLLIDSFEEISREFPEYRLEIYGEGPQRLNLQNQIDKLQLQDKVSLMGSKKDVIKYIYDAELFVLSSDFEGFPNALVEAMTIGLPVISTDFSTGVARDLVKKRNGRIVSVNSQPELSKAMKELLNNDPLRKQMAVQNIMIRKQLSVDKITDKWINLIDLSVKNQQGEDSKHGK